jgi:hypothetical protein
LLFETIESRWLLASLVDLELTPAEINEGDTATLTAKIEDGIGPYWLEVGWEKDLPVEQHDSAAGTTEINLAHRFLEDTEQLPDGTFQIEVTLTDLGQAPSIELASVADNGSQSQYVGGCSGPSISADGSKVVLIAGKLADNDRNGRPGRFPVLRHRACRWDGSTTA